MKAKVWNDNPNTDWKEQFKGEDIKIPKGSFIEMEFYEANEFRGQYSPIRILPDETQDPKSFKMIRIEKIVESANEDNEIEAHQCNMCKKVYATESALLKHSSASHSDREVVIDEEAERVARKKGGRPKAEAHAD